MRLLALVLVLAVAQRPAGPRAAARRSASALDALGRPPSLLMSRTGETESYCMGRPDFAATEGGPVTHVALLARHGDRAPQNALPSLENVAWQCPAAASLVPPALLAQFGPLFANSSAPALPGSCVNGQLTQQGAQQQRELGRSFRSLFVEGRNAFLPARFDPAKVGVRSTSVGRTVLSAYYFFQGLYPGSQPVIRTVPEATDNAFPNAQRCPELRTIWNGVLAGAEYQAFFARELQPLATKYSALWSMNITESTFKAINDMVRSRFCHKLPLPSGLDPRDANRILIGSRRAKNMQAEPKRAIQLAAGSFLADILADSRLNLFQHYSVHDDTLRAVLLALRAFDGRWPPYASHMALVFRADSVSLQFDGVLRPMAPPCRGLYCATKDFEALVAKFRSDC